MGELSKHIRLRPARDVVFRTVDGEAVILSIGSGLYFGLTPVGTRIWELMDEGNTLEEILQKLVAEYDAPEEEMDRDLRQLASQLTERGLVSPVPGDPR
jgi:hypothetical protein